MGALQHGRRGNAERVLARQRRAVTLRVINRLPYAEIARRLLPCDLHAPNGDPECPLCERLYSGPGPASRAVRKRLAEDFPPPTGEERDAYVREEQALLDALIRRAVADALEPGGSSEDRHRAMGSVDRLMRRKAALLGLDAPTQVHVTAELDEQIEAAIALLAGEGGLPELEGVVDVEVDEG